MANYYIESEFTYKNFRCVVVFNCFCGHRCGYVEIPFNHPILDKDCYELSYIDVHGGITFTKYEHATYPLESDSGWIGFDCGHCDDRTDFESWIKYCPENLERIKKLKSILIEDRNATVKSIEFCEKECKKIVDQLIKEVK